MFEPVDESEFEDAPREHDYYRPDTSGDHTQEWTEQEHRGGEGEEELRKIGKTADEMLKKEMERRQKLAHPQNKPDKPRDNDRE